MRLLHLSDLHLGAQASFEQDTVIERLLADVAQEAADNKFDAAIFSGDLTAKGKEPEFLRFRELFLAPLESMLGLAPSRIAVVPGNHDIDRDSISPYLEVGLKTLLTGTTAVDALTTDTPAFADAMQRLHAWDNFASGWARLPVVLHPSGLAGYHPPEIWDGELGIATLNSAWRATGAPNDADRNQQLIVSESHSAWALDQVAPANLRIVMMHHPLHWLTDWSHTALRVELERRGTIVLTGHEHVADPRWVSSGRGSALYLPTGCLFQGNRTRPIAYSIIDLNTRDHNGSITIRSYKPGRGEFDLATEYLPGGKKQFDIPQQAIDSRAALLPRYTNITGKLVEQARSANSFADLIDDSRAGNLFDIIVEPRFFPAPFAQVAAAVALARSQGKSSARLTAVSIGGSAPAVNVSLVSGEGLSGVSNALYWLLADQYERDASRTPIFVRYRRLAGNDPVERLIRGAAQEYGVSISRRQQLPPIIVAIDDVDSRDSAFVSALIDYIGAHPQNRYILGCHEPHDGAVARALGGANIPYVQGYLGPFGLTQLRQLVVKVGGEAVVPHTELIMNLVFGRHLPRSPFVLSAIIAVLASNPTIKLPNESRVIEAVISVLLGKHDPTDTQAGLDARGREDLLQEVARHFVLTDVDRFERREAEQFVAQYFDARGIEGSASPGNHLNALINRRILVQDGRGVGFWHRPFLDVIAASLMRTDHEFATAMLANPPRYVEVIKHAAWLARDDNDLLAKVGEATAPYLTAVIGRAVPFLDKLLGLGISGFTDENIEDFIKLAAPPPPQELEERMAHHFDFREVSEAANVVVPIPPETNDAIGAADFLAKVLAASELVDNIQLKSSLLKRSLQSWNAIAEELGSQDHQFSSIRPLFDELFPDVQLEDRRLVWQFLMRISIVLSVCFGVATSLATDGLAAAARLLDEDDDITSSASLDFMLSLLFAELDLTGYVERIRSTLDRHGANIVVCDLLKAIAMTKYLSPYTRANDVTELEAFLLDAVAPLAPASGRRRGSNAVQGRSEARSRLQTRLRQARIRLQAQPVGDDLVDELLELDASTSD